MGEAVSGDVNSKQSAKKEGSRRQIQEVPFNIFDLS